MSREDKIFAEQKAKEAELERKNKKQRRLIIFIFSVILIFTFLGILFYQIKKERNTIRVDFEIEGSSNPIVTVEKGIGSPIFLNNESNLISSPVWRIRGGELGLDTIIQYIDNPTLEFKSTGTYKIFLEGTDPDGNILQSDVKTLVLDYPPNFIDKKKESFNKLLESLLDPKISVEREEEILDSIVDLTMGDIILNLSVDSSTVEDIFISDLKKKIKGKVDITDLMIELNNTGGIANADLELKTIDINKIPGKSGGDIQKAPSDNGGEKKPEATKKPVENNSQKEKGNQESAKEEKVVPPIIPEVTLQKNINDLDKQYNNEPSKASATIKEMVEATTDDVVIEIIRYSDPGKKMRLDMSYRAYLMSLTIINKANDLEIKEVEYDAKTGKIKYLLLKEPPIQ